MRLRHLAVLSAVVAASVSTVPSVLARSPAPMNDPVTITDTHCDLSRASAPKGTTEIVFGVFNGGTVSHRFFIGGPYATHWVKPQQEETLIVTFTQPGMYKWVCVSHRRVIQRGVFTIRR
jgi:hypothetical protein